MTLLLLGFMVGLFAGGCMVGFLFVSGVFRPAPNGERPPDQWDDRGPSD